MPRRPPALLPRLLADCVLPCAFAAMAFAGLLALHQLHRVDDDARLRIAAQIERIASALQRNDGTPVQQRLDDARGAEGADAPRRIDLRESDGRELHSGIAADPAFERYRRELPDGAGRRRILTIHVDSQPHRHERQRVVLDGILSESGIVLLALLSALTLRRHVLAPLQRLQLGIDALPEHAGASGVMDAPETYREFARLRDSVTTLAARLAAQRAERATARHSTADDALEQLRQSQAAQRGKAQFMALVGHHFRQPTQALQLIAAGLHPGIDDEQQALLAQMRDSVAGMTRLLDALLEISRLDAGVVSMSPAPFSVAELFLRDRAALLARARLRGVELVWHGRPRQLHGDIGLAGALLCQLAANAVAHAGPRGRVLVCARRLRDGVRIEVRDNGPGIAAIHQQRIFEEFVQLHDDGDGHEGYGLGLAIAARLARVLGTRVGLHSRPGGGSTFWFELPCMSSADRGHAAVRDGMPASRPLR